MRLIKQYHEILHPKLDITGSGGVNLCRKLERAARTCYKSEDKITDISYIDLLRMILNRGHESVLEHESISVLFVTDRGVTHEMVRHRLNAFSQESTRYCDYGGSDVVFIIPSWLWTKDLIPEGVYGHDYAGNLEYPKGLRDIGGITWMNSMVDAELNYKRLRDIGWSPQGARTVLPNSLKTEIVMTANIRQWRHVLKLRTSKAAHPQMRDLMLPLLGELKRVVPVLFDDIEVEVE